MQGEQLERKVPKTAAIAIAIIAAAGIIGAVFALDIAKAVAPGYYCANALGSLAGEIPKELGSSELGQLFSKPWGAEVTAKLSEVSEGKPGYMQLIDSSAVRLFKMLGAKLDVGLSPDSGRAAGRLLLDLSGRPLLDVDIWASGEVLSARFKELADYYIEIDPRLFASDWNLSAFSGIAEIGGKDPDSAFYSKYEKIIDSFPKSAKRAFTPWKPKASYRDLAKGAKFTYVDKVKAETSAGEAEADQYSATLKADAIDAWLKAVSSELSAYSTSGLWQDADDFLSALEGAKFDEDVTLTIQVINGRLLSLGVAGAKMSQGALSGSMRFHDTSAYFKDASMEFEITGGQPAAFESKLKAEEGKAALSFAGSSPSGKASMEAEKDGGQYKVKLEMEKGKDSKTSKTTLETSFGFSGQGLEVNVPLLRVESKEAKGEMFAEFSGKASVAPKDEAGAGKPAPSKLIYGIWDDDLTEMQENILSNEALLSVLNNDF
jgi:hypothetical protein